MLTLDARYIGDAVDHISSTFRVVFLFIMPIGLPYFTLMSGPVQEALNDEKDALI